MANSTTDKKSLEDMLPKSFYTTRGDWSGYKPQSAVPASQLHDQIDTTTIEVICGQWCG